MRYKSIEKGVVLSFETILLILLAVLSVVFIASAILPKLNVTPSIHPTISYAKITLLTVNEHIINVTYFSVRVELGIYSPKTMNTDICVQALNTSTYQSVILTCKRLLLKRGYETYAFITRISHELLKSIGCYPVTEDCPVKTDWRIILSIEGYEQVVKPEYNIP